MKSDKLKILMGILLVGFHCHIYGQDSFMSINGKRVEILIKGLEHNQANKPVIVFEKANEIYKIIFHKYTDVFYETYLNYGISLLANHENEKAKIFFIKSMDINPKMSSFDLFRLKKARQLLKEL